MIATNKALAGRIEKLDAAEADGSVIELLVEEIDSLTREIEHVKTLPTPPRRTSDRRDAGLKALAY